PMADLGGPGGGVLTTLSMAKLPDRLQHDPGLVGKRYQLTVDEPASDTRTVEGVPGVAAAAPRYVTFATDSFQLGESFKVVAYPGDHTAFEAPPLAAGRRVRSAGQAEVGTGLAGALGGRPGAEPAGQRRGGAAGRARAAG